MSSKNFPLYDTFYKNSRSKALTLKEEVRLKSLIDKMDLNGFERLYIIIKLYSMNHPPLDIPPPDINGDIEFDVATFPPKLQRMAFNFVEKHVSVNEEDNKKELLEKFIA